MYRLSPPSLHIADRALADPLSAARAERMLAALGHSLADAVPFGDDDIPELIAQQGWTNARARQGRHDGHLPLSLVFSTLRFDNPPAVAPLLERCPAGTSSWLVASLLGHGGRHTAREDINSTRGICRPRVQFDTIYGCPHGCKYCPGGQVSVVMCNCEEFVQRQVIPAAEQEPWQKVFMFNSSLSDTPCFEPEYGLSKLLVDYFASTKDQHYLIHTKSANTDFLCDLDHRGHTLLLWSVTGATSARFVEPGTATPDERIEAAHRCQQAGYPVRFKLKPIVPVKGWRDEYRYLIDRILTLTRPDSIGLFMLAWMDAAELEANVDVSLLDPAFLAALRESADEMKGVTAGPFPHAARAEVYRFLIEEIRRRDADVPLFLCTETAAMWRDLGPLLGASPGSYVCGCGPQSRPGLTRIEQLLVPMEMRSV